MCLWSAGGARSRDSSSCVWGVSLYVYCITVCVERCSVQSTESVIITKSH